VIDGVTIKEIATTKSAHLSEEAGGKPVPPRRLEIVDGPYFGADGLDVAVFRVDLGATPLPAIAVSQHTDYALGENTDRLRAYRIDGPAYCPGQRGSLR
jgi:hypothetical protein